MTCLEFNVRPRHVKSAANRVVIAKTFISFKGNFDLPDEETQNNTTDTNGVAMNSANTGSPSKPIEETGQTKQVVGEDSSVPAKTATTSMREDFVTMKNGQPERIVYTAGRIHYNQTLKYGIKSGKFMDKGKVVNISQCISACGRQPDCDVAFMLGTQCYAVSCHTKTLCLTKPAYSAFYNPVIVFVTKRKIFSVGKLFRFIFLFFYFFIFLFI